MSELVPSPAAVDALAQAGSPLVPRCIVCQRAEDEHSPRCAFIPPPADSKNGEHRG